MVTAVGAPLLVNVAVPSGTTGAELQLLPVVHSLPAPTHVPSTACAGPAPDATSATTCRPRHTLQRHTDRHPGRPHTTGLHMIPNPPKTARDAPQHPDGTFIVPWKKVSGNGSSLGHEQGAGKLCTNPFLRFPRAGRMPRCRFGWPPGSPRMFDGTVDAVHFAENHAHEADIAAQAMPFLKRLSDDRLKARAEESRAGRSSELIAPITGATFTGNESVTRDAARPAGTLRQPRADRPAGRRRREHLAGDGQGRDLRLRPSGRDRAARPASADRSRPSSSPGTAAPRPRAPSAAALPFLEAGRQGHVIVADAEPDDVGTPLLMRRLGRHGIAASLDATRLGALTGPRPRPRPAGLCQGQGGRSSGDGRLRTRRAVQFPGAGRRHRQGDRCLPDPAPAGSLTEDFHEDRPIDAR